MAECIAEGLRETDPTLTVKLFNSAVDDKNDIVTEVFKSKAILVGSPTINYGFLFSIGGIMEMIRGLKFKNKKAAAFGSYGWSGEAVKQITALLQGRRQRRPALPVESGPGYAGYVPSIRPGFCSCRQRFRSQRR